ncbi:MAG: hypothetical protein IJY96_08880 [Oscillospiraceae bacterium]|nr:hypothetical protein [Oscillospiraceae bacterium]
MKKLLAAFALALILCGCAQSETPTELTPAPTPVQTETPAPTPTPTPTPTPVPTPTPLAAEPGTEIYRYEYGEAGDYIDYWLSVPKNAVEGMPLLIFLHGDGNMGRPESLENNPIQVKIKEIYGDEAPFLTLMPNTRLYSWTAGSLPEMLISLANSVAEEYNADSDKIMLTGHSRGAIGTWYYISNYPEMFSAAAPISCGCDEVLDYESMADVPVWGFCGNVGQDGTHYLPAMERIAEGINAAGGNARIDVLMGCDHAAAESAAYTEELFEWLLSQ